MSLSSPGLVDRRGHAVDTTAGHWTLSPSDLTFLWNGCLNCFYNKIVHKLGQPRTPMPAVFSHIDSRMKECFLNQRIEDVVPGVPGGTIAHSEQWVESAPLTVPGRAATVTIRGKFDTVVRFDDDSYGVLDYKTSAPNDRHIPLYSRQLHAYAWALENPAPKRPHYSPVSRLGLLIFQPKRFTHRAGANNGIDGYFGGGLHWLEIPRDDTAFFAFLGKVLDVLEEPESPVSSPECDYCNYRDTARRTGW